MSEPRIALVTGANKGIGLQIAKDLAARGLTVLVAGRDLAAAERAARGIAGARAIELDVTKPTTIAAAAAHIEREHGHLDVLVNNAGVSHVGGERSIGESMESGRPSTATLDHVRAVFETNVFGVVAVTQAMLPLLRKGSSPRVVNVSSGVGSLTLMSDPKQRFGFGSVGYAPSKTALNAVTVAFATELEGTGIKVNAACPGFVGTELNHFAGPRTVAEGAREPVRLALLPDDGPSGTFSNEDGPLPW